MTQVHQLAQKAALFGFGMLLLSTSTGCGASLAQPFDQLKASNSKVYIYRLQNFEPPAQQAAASATSLIPPQIQQWVQGAANLLPPGLLPPGLLPGTAATTTDATAARFRNFRILGWMEITDSKTLTETYDIFGKEKNFVAPQSTCMYAEFGFSFQPQNGGPKNDVLVSLSCNNTQAFDFAWPHGMKTGLASGTTNQIIDVAKKTFGGG